MKRSKALSMIVIEFGCTYNKAEHILNFIQFDVGMLPPELLEKSWKFNKDGTKTYAVNEWREEDGK